MTRCSASQPIETLTATQVAGLFLGLYHCDEDACRVSLHDYPLLNIHLGAKIPPCILVICTKDQKLAITFMDYLMEITHGVLIEAHHRWSQGSNMFCAHY